MVIIKYGIINNNIDVTDIALTKCMKQNIIFIPKNDTARASYFSDPLVNILKSIFIIKNMSLVKTVFSTRAWDYAVVLFRVTSVFFC